MTQEQELEALKTQTQLLLLVSVPCARLVD